MPAAEQILEALERIANEWRDLALWWHVYFAAFALALAGGWRPVRATAGLLLAAPLAGVSTLAWMADNPVNGAAFALAAAGTLALPLRAPRARVRCAGAAAVAAGALLLAFGLIYPHFLHVPSWAAYWYSAPTGLIPCPTLAAVAGIGLILDGLGSRSWSMAIGLTGIVYGLLGAVYLGVAIDWILCAGAVLLAVAGGRRTHQNGSAPGISGTV